ncbi:MAG: DUF5985 family protein [Verrucomicrobiota bacterium]|nr:DUF5985 family protein [Verrucomicrobiota bacterium]
MDLLVYILCALTSLGCAVALSRQYGSAKVPLLLWSAVAFSILVVTNLLLIVDFILLPDVDLGILRNLTTLTAVVLLLYGCIKTNT